VLDQRKSSESRTCYEEKGNLRSLVLGKDLDKGKGRQKEKMAAHAIYRIREKDRWGEGEKARDTTLSPRGVREVSGCLLTEASLDGTCPVTRVGVERNRRSQRKKKKIKKLGALAREVCDGEGELSEGKSNRKQLSKI